MQYILQKKKYFSICLSKNYKLLYFINYINWNVLCCMLFYLVHVYLLT